MGITDFDPLNWRIGRAVGNIWDSIYNVLGERVERYCDVEIVYYGTSTWRRTFGSGKRDLYGVLLTPKGVKVKDDFVFKFNHAWETGPNWYKRKAAKKAVKFKRRAFLPCAEGHENNPGLRFLRYRTNEERNDRGWISIKTSLGPFFPAGLPLSSRYLRDSRDANLYLRQRFGKDVQTIEIGHSNGANTLLQLQDKHVAARIAYAAPVFLPDNKLLGTISYARKVKEPTLLVDGLYDPATFPLFNQFFIFRALPNDIDKVCVTYWAEHLDGMSDIYINPFLAWWRGGIVDEYTDAFIEREVFCRNVEWNYELLTTKRLGVVDIRHNLLERRRRATS